MSKITRRTFLEIRRWSQRCSGAALDSAPSFAATPARSMLTKYLQPLPLPGAGIVVATPSGTTSTRSRSARSRGSCILSCRRRRSGPTTTAPGWRARRARSGWRWSRRAARRSSQLHARPASHLPGLDSGRHAADAARHAGAADDPSARRLCRRRQRRQPGGHAGRIRPRRDADRLLHEPAAADAGVAAVVPRPRSGHDAAERLRRARRRLHPPRRVRHRRGAEPDRHSGRAPTRSRWSSRTASSTRTGRSSTRPATSPARPGSASTSAT